MNTARITQYVRYSILRIFIIMCLPAVVNATPANRVVAASPHQVIQLGGQLVDQEKYDAALQILSALPATRDTALETERQFLLGQIAARTGDIEQAIKIYNKLLDEQPDLPRVRFELAICYMKNNQWYRADYHLRLAMAGQGLGDEIKQMMYYYRWVVRQNKNWNLWFNFGAAPDNNINNTVGGEECVMTMFGLMCRQLPEPESAFGVNLTVGGNYEFKMSPQHWRWKSDANLYTNTYNKHDYDDWLLSVGTGPRYVWRSGDIWLAAIGNRRWYGWRGYSTSAGLRTDFNYDFSRRWTGGLQLRTVENFYDKYGRYMDGFTYGTAAYLSYAINAQMSVVLYGGLDYEDTKDDIYTNLRPAVGVGFNSELPWGFYLHAEPYFYWSDYKGARWVVKNNTFKRIAEHSFTQRYSVSVSNNKFDIWGFVPTLTVIYTHRDSNIWQREFDKWSAEFTMRQRF